MNMLKSYPLYLVVIVSEFKEMVYVMHIKGRQVGT